MDRSPSCRKSCSSSAAVETDASVCCCGCDEVACCCSSGSMKSPSSESSRIDSSIDICAMEASCNVDVATTRGWITCDCVPGRGCPAVEDVIDTEARLSADDDAGEWNCECIVGGEKPNSSCWC